MEAIKTVNLTKIYQPPSGIKRLLIKAPLKKRILAVDNVNLRIPKGKIFGLIGPNGAGKTSLIKILATLIYPTAGQAYVNGYDVIKEEGKVKQVVGYGSSDERSFYFRLTGWQNLIFFALLYNLDKHSAKKKTQDLLQFFKLEKAAHQMYYTYSTGMRQKLILARALIANPDVLFLDEPTKGLDSESAAEIRMLIRQIAKEQGKTVVITSHDLNEIEQLVDTFAIMKQGRIVYQGSVEGLRQQLLISKNGNGQLPLQELYLEYLRRAA